MPPPTARNPHRSPRSPNQQPRPHPPKIRPPPVWRNKKLSKYHFSKIKNPFAYEKNVELLDEFFLCFWIFKVFLFQEFLADDADDRVFQQLVVLCVFSSSIQLKFKLNKVLGLATCVENLSQGLEDLK